MQQMPSFSETVSTIGFFLTLTGLLGTFFYVHLSNWFRDILELECKYEENAKGEDERRRQGRIECKFQLRKLFNHVTWLISLIITTFLGLMACLAWQVIPHSPDRNPLFGYYETAFKWFFATYLLLTLYFLISGYGKACRLHRRINKKDSTQG